ncbi:MAG TPA: hypothetical protein PKV27_07160 [Ilumatobacteraceae bacterium]|nr:hypothetical protein [Ilumatobacteraceae bacterium]
MKARAGLAVFAGCALLLAGCAERDEFTDSTLPPITSDQIAAATTTSTIDLAPADQGPRTPTITGDGCELTPVPATGSATLTYSIGGSILELSADATEASCVIENVVPPPGEVIWAPGGNSLLIGPATLRNVFGAFPTGLVDTDTTVRWSYPDGAYLLSVNDRGRLDRRTAGNARARQSLYAMDRTTTVTAHPAGEHLLIGGTARDRTVGIWIANLEGRSARPIVTVPTDGAAITEISSSSSGDQIGFVATVGERFELFIGRLPELTLARVLDVQTPLAALTQSASGALAVRVGACAGRTTTQMYAGGTMVDVSASGALANRSTSPVGWLDANRLIVIARDTGCEGSGDLWAVNVANPNLPQLLVSAVDRVAIRPGPVRATPIGGNLAPNPASVDLA